MNMSPNSTAGGGALASEGPAREARKPSCAARPATYGDGDGRGGGVAAALMMRSGWLVRVFSPVGKPIGVLAYLVKSMQSTYGTIGTTCNDLKLSYPTFFPAPGGPGAARRTPRTSRVIGTLLPGGGGQSKNVRNARGGGLTPLAKGSPL